MSAGAATAPRRLREPDRADAGGRRAPLPILACLALALSLAGAREAWPGKAVAPDLRPVRVKNVILDRRTRQPIVLLEEKEGNSLLPIWIGPAEAQAIMMELNEVKPPRPLTHDLMRNIIGSLNGKVVRVVITDLKNGTFYAHIVMNVSGKIVSIDSRPSDAIALALRVRAPIFVQPEALKAAISRGPDGPAGYRRRLGLILQKMTGALARYFGGGAKMGLLVSQIDAEGPAARAGLRRGDVIYEVEGRPVSTIRALESALSGRPEELSVSFRRGAEEKHIKLHPAEKSRAGQ
ncbi:MAG: bifunctional nuclease domain-containing protein [bacterium]